MRGRAGSCNGSPIEISPGRNGADAESDSSAAHVPHAVVTIQHTTLDLKSMRENASLAAWCR
jgi:hypothetical protein